MFQSGYRRKRKGAHPCSPYEFNGSESNLIYEIVRFFFFKLESGSWISAGRFDASSDLTYVLPERAHLFPR